MTPDLAARVQAALAALTPRPQKLLLAWSGGLDSTVLLHALIPACQALQVALHAAHADHQLRPCSSQDAAFCQAEAARLRVPFNLLTLNIPRTGSTQAAARSARYDALAHLARAIHADAIATAHHADDAAESALLHLQRGHGALGLSSLTHIQRPLPHHPDLWLIRPLIHTSRADLLAWATHHQITWVEDPTNAGDDYTRNLLRHHALPALYAAPGAAQGVARALATLAQEADLIEQLASALRQQAQDPCWPEPDSVALDASALQRVHPALLARLWQQLATSPPLSLQALPAHHIDALTAWVQRGDDGALQLPGALAEREGPLLTLTASPGQGTKALLASRLLAPTPLVEAAGEVGWFGGVVRWRWVEAPGAALELRAWRAGDRWGEDGGKIKEALRALGVPQRVRWRWPLVASRDSHSVWWVAGLPREAPGLRITWLPIGQK
jgi:tRNA(Ile)-lysidine synthetase-like protein